MKIPKDCLVVLERGECGCPYLSRLNWCCSSSATGFHVVMLMKRVVWGLSHFLWWEMSEPGSVFHFLSPYIFSGQPRGDWALLKLLRWISVLGSNHCLESYQKVSENRSWVLHEESYGPGRRGACWSFLEWKEQSEDILGGRKYRSHQCVVPLI